MAKVTKKGKRKKPYEIGELDQYLFSKGTHYDLYQKMGAHHVKDGKKEGIYFSVWAPHAKKLSVIGEFNNLDMEANAMERKDPL